MIGLGSSFDNTNVLPVVVIDLWKAVRLAKKT